MSDLEAPPTRPARARRLALVALVLAVVALAAALRFYNLGGQSLWNDEGTSVALAGRNLSQITLSAAADIHPPLYHYLLHYWLRLFGGSDVAARSLSALLGVGVVGLTYLMGRRLFGPVAGLAAAALLALSSYQVYYAQEARMYMLLTFLGVASMCLFDAGWLDARARWRAWAMGGWVAATTLAMYTHYLAGGLVLAQNAAWAPAFALALHRAPGQRARWLKRTLAWLGAQAVVAFLYLPWLRLTWRQLHRWPAVSQPFGLLALLRRTLPLFTLGPTVEAGPLAGLAAAVFGLAALGLAWPEWRGERSVDGRILALFYWLAPVGVLYYLSFSRPVFHPKFLVLAAPGFALLAGRGVARLAPAPGASLSGGLAWSRRAAVCCAGALIVAASAPGLRNYYFDPRYARDDYRSIAEYLSAVGRPGDVILINAPSQIETVARYYCGPLPLVPIPLQRPPDREATVRGLERLAAQAQRIYGVFWASNESDPERIVEGWLDQHAYKAIDAWYGNVRLVAYAVPAAQAGEGIQHPLSVDLAGQIRLEGYALAAGEVASGDILQLALFWQATGTIPRRYKVFTHLIDAAGHLAGQRDSEPCGGTSFTDTWQPGQRIADRYGLPVPPGTPPGEYQLIVGMYNPEDGQRLPIAQGGEAVGDHVVLQKVRVVRPPAPPPPAALGMQQRRSLKGAEVQLLGFSFGRAGALDQAPAPLQPGTTAELVLFWQAQEAPRDGLQVLIRVVDREGRTVLEATGPPVGGRYPVRGWQAREIVRDSWHLPLPAGLPPGRYRLLVGWHAEGSAPAEPAVSELVTFAVQ